MKRNRHIFVRGLAILGALLSSPRLPAQPSEAPQHAETVPERVQRLEDSLRYAEESLTRRLEEATLFRRLDDIAVVDKVRYTGPPLRVNKNPTGQGAGNPLIVSAYTFIPKSRSAEAKMPLIVLVHGGVHANFESSNVHILRELIQQGYAVIAPDYRGSTGYGKDFWQAIDYGGLEVEDVYAGKVWMLENNENIDPERVGIMGWSHGGLITLMNLYNHPTDYKCGYAGVPVSDLIARMGYKDQRYRDLYSAPYHIGKTAEENVNEYRKRSPAWNAEKLQSPLLIHTNTNDEDVNVLEVEHLIKSLKAAGKSFEHKIYQAAPGGHSFNRLDTKLAKESRAEIYRFLAKHLNPPNPVK
jgi:dipeptidyl aminopeptidase/acylaminoacyl peptidase